MRSGAIILAALLVACAAPTSSDGKASAVSVALEGAFRPAEDAASAEIRFVSFEEDDRYQLVPRGCDGAACVEGGVFRLDRAHDRIELTPDGERPAYSLPLVVRQTRAGSATRPSSIVGGSDGALVEDGAQPLVASSVTLAGREYELIADPKKNRKSHAGSASALNAFADQTELRKTSQQRAVENCGAAQTEVPANGDNICTPGDRIWGNRLVNTVAATACEAGYIYTTCTTIITITTITID